MYDYAQVQLLGRATSDAEFNITEDGLITKATFVVALNIPIRRDNTTEVKTLFRRVMVLGYYAKYVSDCESDDSLGLKGRLINVVGVMDNEDNLREVVRVAPGAGFIKIMDRRIK